MQWTRLQVHILTSLKKARKRGGVKWNKAYQAVKHDRKNSLKSGNISNLINALGALYILNIYYMDRKINLGVSMNPTQEFDNRLGSEIFAVPFSDATIKVEIGGSGKDDAFMNGVKDKFIESIYILKYTKLSWKNVNNAFKTDNERLYQELIESKKFKHYINEHPGEIEKERGLRSLVNKILGVDYIRNHNSMGNFSAAFMNA